MAAQPTRHASARNIANAPTLSVARQHARGNMTAPKAQELIDSATMSKVFGCAGLIAMLHCLSPAPTSADEPPSAAAPIQSAGLEEQINDVFGQYVVAPLASVLFFDLLFMTEATKLPFIVAWLVLGAVFFTLRMGFINIRGFSHAVAVTLGRYDNASDPGEVSHFQALSSALSATVGLGNIAGVALAVGAGGPGAVFWMIVAGFLGMTSKFVECTLGQMYRKVDASGHVLGGPMRYLAVGIAELGYKKLGRTLAVTFSVLCIGGSFGGGNMFQSNQSYAQVQAVVPYFSDKPWLYGLLIATAVGVVIIGGIRRIGAVAGYIVPLMCGIYLIAGAAILITHADKLPDALGHIIRDAFTPQAGMGGFLGVLVTGFQRAAFSNEAGIGSASIAHSAAATNEPIREGIVALLEPFIDTIIVCTMTGLVVVVTGAYHDTESNGVAMTSSAFASVMPWFPDLLAVAVFFFAYSTMISWSYYGERSAAFLFGPQSSMPYRFTYLLFAFLGPLLQLDNVVAFSDLMILGMALPNILGAVLLAPRVRTALDRYRFRFMQGPPRNPTGNGDFNHA